MNETFCPTCFDDKSVSACSDCRKGLDQRGACPLCGWSIACTCHEDGPRCTVTRSLGGPRCLWERGHPSPFHFFPAAGFAGRCTRCDGSGRVPYTFGGVYDANGVLQGRCPSCDPANALPGVLREAR